MHLHHMHNNFHFKFLLSEIFMVLNASSLINVIIPNEQNDPEILGYRFPDIFVQFVPNFADNFLRKKQSNHSNS